MRLTKFRIKKYRSIEDSGEIPVDEKLCTFVGINESGKTNIFRALRKLNSVIDTGYDDLIEEPTWHFAEFNPEEIFITVTFKLNPEEQEKVSEISSGRHKLSEIKFSKKKNMQLVCHLESDQVAIPFESFQTTYLKPIYSTVDEIQPGSIPDGQKRKNQLTQTLKTFEKGHKGQINVRKPEILEDFKTNLKILREQVNSIPSEQYDKTKLLSLFDKVDQEVTEDSTEVVKNYLINKLPRFIYFENTAIIDSRIHLPTFVQKLASNVLDEDEKTAKTLLDLGGLDANELYSLAKQEGKELGQARKDSERSQQLCSLASKKITEQIDKIWTQNDHNIEITVDGNHLRVWVINRDDGTKLQLEERSRGYQWYFSFYTIFNVESENTHKDAILLLDEPALFLHPMGQKDVLKRTLPQLAEKNQILYSTHSPFMIDLSKPEALHTVTLVKKGSNNVTTISKDVWPTDKNALFPLQSALGYQLSQTMFIGRKNLIVEGMTDYWILNSASALLESGGKTSLKDDFAFSPAGGGTKSVLLSTMYSSQDLQVGVLLDADSEGKNAYEQIVKNKILKSDKVLLLNEILGKTNSMSLEDLFPEEYYLKFVEKSYQEELNGKKIVLESDNPMIIKRIEAFFKKENLGEFHKSRPAREIMNEFGSTSLDTLPNTLVEKLEKVFEAINKIMK